MFVHVSMLSQTDSSFYGASSEETWPFPSSDGSRESRDVDSLENLNTANCRLSTTSSASIKTGIGNRLMSFLEALIEFCQKRCDHRQLSLF